MAQAMDCTFSVFSGHVNDADKRARAILARVSPNALERLQEVEVEHGGTMGIFRQPPEPATMMYAGMVMGFVNEERT